MRTRAFNYLANPILAAGCFILGCTGSGTLGCGSSAGGGEEAASVDSELPAIYQITSYQGSEDGCDQVADIPSAPSYLVFYAFHPNSAPQDSRLGATFCGTVEQCRRLADFAAEPVRGYSFITGDDNAGWTGYGILSNGSVGDTDQCQAELQIHMLTVPGADGLSIETRTVETTYKAEADGTSATCSNAKAIASVTDDLPCKAILLLEATHEAEL